MKSQESSTVPEQPQLIIRKGGRFELIGFVLIAAGMLIGMAASGGLGGMLALIGVCVFIYGRFL